LIGVRKVWPENLPLTVRLSVVEFNGNDEAMLNESIDLLRRMKQEGLDFVDVSIGFNTPKAKIPWAPNFMVPTAERVRLETGLPGTTSWYISQPDEADALVQERKLDLVMLARPLLANPHWPFEAAKALGVENPAWTTLPAPYAHWLAHYR
jgi:2,4-dienoyl-CoA reductase-like NADH-dependent reductase (Old Yellow Enzyme family)